MEQASKLATTPVAIYASSNDVLANLTTLVRPTCDGINAASSAAGKGNMCTIRVQSGPYGSTSRVSAPPNHNQLCEYNKDAVDVNYVIKGYGGKSVTVSKNGNITDPSAATTTTSKTTTTTSTSSTTTTTSSTSTSITTTDTASSTSTTSTTTVSSTDAVTPTPTSTSTSDSTTTSSTTSSSTTTDASVTPTDSSSGSSDIEPLPQASAV